MGTKMIHTLPYMRTEIMLLGALAFLLCCLNCYLVYRKKKPNTPKMKWLTLFATIFVGGISIILMMYFAFLYLWLFGIYFTPVAIILLISVLTWQSAILTSGWASGITLTLAYVLCWLIGIWATGIQTYHG